MVTTPTWSAARNGLTGDANAVDKSSQIDQYLGTHGVTPIYTGTPIVTPTGIGASSDDPANFWNFHLDIFDYDQPFMMSGTNIGRISLPILPVGEGADLLVSLCNDASGLPGSVIASSYIPKEWISAFAAYGAVASPADTVFLEPTNSPLALAQFNPLQTGAWVETTWTSPSVGSAGGSNNPTIVSSGNYMITVGGQSSVGGAAVPSVFTVAYPGSGYQLGVTTPQPVLPVGNAGIMAVTTSDSLVVAGGAVGATFTLANTSYIAPWDSTQGVVGAWSQQPNLPTPLTGGGMAAFGETVYIVGGTIDEVSDVRSTVLYATIANGQITAWNTGPSLPAGLCFANVSVVGNFLVVYGGNLAPLGTGPLNANVYIAPIFADGTLGGWQTTPTKLAVPVIGFANFTSDSGIVQVGGFTNSSLISTTDAVQTFGVDASGPGPLNRQRINFGPTTTNFVGFSIDVAQWQIFGIFDDEYFSAALYVMPTISVPLPATGLTNGATYHILLQQQGGTSSNFLRTSPDANSLPGNPTVLFRQRGTSGWTSFAGGFQIPITVYNQGSSGQVLHTWEDNGARTSTLVYATTPDARLLGIADSVQFLDGAVIATVTTVDYPNVWPGTVWPPLGAQQIA